MDAPTVAGIDGCPGGWVVAMGPADGEGRTDVHRVPDLSEIMTMVDTGRLAAVGIDMPIGLPTRGPRPCDVEARRRIESRRSSVFPAPARGVLGATTYDEARHRSRAISGKSLSRQTFGILPKIQDVDRLMTPNRQKIVVEMHPELCFTVLGGSPMRHNKTTPEGRSERLIVLRDVFIDVDEQCQKRWPGVRPDDVLDALVVAWSARRWWARIHERLGGEPDARGLRMEIVA